MGISEPDLHDLPDFLLGKGQSFMALLIRLIAKADSENREKLRKVFPEEVAAFEHYIKEGR